MRHLGGRNRAGRAPGTLRRGCCTKPWWLWSRTKREMIEFRRFVCPCGCCQRVQDGGSRSKRGEGEDGEARAGEKSA